jgi:tetratricopeptide (TPR) repeat protein
MRAVRQNGRLSHISISVLPINYESLADHYEENDQYELRALALEKALEYRPDDISMRFEAGRAYHASGFDALSLFHYGTLLQISPQDSYALNNSGVNLASLDMPTRAVESYRAAYALGNTLAAANLAYLYIGAGFTDDASRLLDEAKQMDDPHPNVAAAIARVSSAKESDEEKQKATTKTAREQRMFMSAYAQRYFLPTTDTAGFVREWQSDEGHRVSIAQEDDTIKASWTAKKKTYSFTAKVHGATAILSEIRGRDVDTTIWLYPETVADKGCVPVKGWQGRNHHGSQEQRSRVHEI